MTQEKRKFSRISEQCVITYSAAPDYKSKRKISADLSAGGLRFISDHFLPLGSIVRIQLSLKYIPRVINAVAKVMRVKEIFDDECYEVGAEFVDIARPDLRFLHKYLDR